MRRCTTALLVATLTTTTLAQQASLKGIEAGDLDRSAQPCDNFYQFANGTWRAQNPIPASMDRWSRRWRAGEENKDKLRTILAELAAQPGQPSGSPGQLTGDFYAACTDVASIDAAGLRPLQPLLDAIDHVHDSASLQPAITTLQAVGIGAPFNFGSTPNPHNPEQVIAVVGAGGLGLPDRDYYLKPEPRFAEARTQYLAFIEHLSTLAGATPAQAHTDAATIMRLETDLARASLDNVALRDPHATDHLVPFTDLEHANPHFNWSAFYQANHLTPAQLNIDQPAFLAALDHALTTVSLADWKTYLRWHLLRTFAPSLSTPFVDANFNFYEHQLAGVGELKPRPIRCAAQADTLLGDPLGQEYVKRYFPPAAKQRATEMVTNLLAAMHGTLEGLDWMTPATKQQALSKLSTFRVKVGYPDHWKDESSVPIARDAYLADVLAGARFVVADDLRQINHPVDRDRWGLTPPTSDAYYNPLLNEIVFPAGILQPPAFSVDDTDAVNYGAIGVVIGHEVSHGFDDQGAQFDAQGKLRNWWTPDDLAKFQAKTACVSRQFSSYTIDGGGDIHINGQLTLGESVADLAGLKLAYLAFQRTPQARSGQQRDGFTPDQQFFIAWGQFRGDSTRPETQKLMVQGDPHPIAKYRVLGPDSNFPPFAQAFSCKPGSPMVRPAAERCVVW